MKEQNFEAWIEDIRGSLIVRSEHWREHGYPQIAAEGKLLRPLVAFCVAGVLDPSLHEDERFWDATLALQMVHEASLMHDDIIDQAATRRGQVTLVAQKGVATALVYGDHLLTAAYRLIANTGCMGLIERFAEAVEQTVMGEIEQARSIGKAYSSYEYTSMIAKKSGALFGLSMAIAPLLLEDKRARSFWELGVRLGCQYQRLDDLLDYCPHAESGKPVYQDHRQRKPTWLKLHQPKLSWTLTPTQLQAMLFAPTLSHGAHATTASALLGVFTRFGAALREDLKSLLGPTSAPLLLLKSWEDLASRAIAREEQHYLEQIVHQDKHTSKLPQPMPTTPSASLDTSHKRLQQLLAKEGLMDASSWLHYFRHHSHSFSFAAKFFPPTQRAQVTNVYAYCRVTDDLADGFGEIDTPTRRTLLNEWEQLTCAAYDGEETGFPLLDQTIGEMAAAQVPVSYALELIEGMRMDLHHVPPQDLEQLMLYCYRAASTVGLWLTELFGCHDRWVLSRASALGKAMQLTNILRDVGTDLALGRMYLPTDLLQEAGLNDETLLAMSRRERPIVANYKELMEKLMGIAEELYRHAYEGMALLPSFFARPVSAAASIYEGIHREIRKNNYDNLTHRAYTSTSRKIALAALGWFRLWQARRAASKPAAPLLTESPWLQVPALPAQPLLLPSQTRRSSE